MNLFSWLFGDELYWIQQEFLQHWYFSRRIMYCLDSCYFANVVRLTENFNDHGRRYIICPLARVPAREWYYKFVLHWGLPEGPRVIRKFHPRGEVDIDLIHEWVLNEPINAKSTRFNVIYGQPSKSNKMTGADIEIWLSVLTFALKLFNQLFNTRYP